jgi:hypothetical protein
MLRRFNLRHEKLSELGECSNQGNFFLTTSADGAAGERLFSQSQVGSRAQGGLLDDLF